MDNTFKPNNGYREICMFALFVMLTGYLFPGSETGRYIAAFCVLVAAIGLAYFDGNVSVATALSMGIIAISVDTIGMPWAMMIITPYVVMIMAMYRKSTKWMRVWFLITLIATLVAFYIGR